MIAVVIEEMHGADRHLIWVDYERALVGTGNCFSTRAKWRALRSARSSTLKKYLTPPTLSETRCFANHLDGALTGVEECNRDFAIEVTSSFRTIHSHLFSRILPGHQTERCCSAHHWACSPALADTIMPHGRMQRVPGRVGRLGFNKCVRMTVQAPRRSPALKRRTLSRSLMLFPSSQQFSRRMARSFM